MHFGHEVNNLWTRKAHRKILCRLEKEKLKGHFLDVGQRSILTTKLEAMLNAHTDNTDLEWRVEPNKYRTVFLFDTLEHLMNPLLCLRGIESSMIS